MSTPQATVDAVGHGAALGAITVSWAAVMGILPGIAAIIASLMAAAWYGIQSYIALRKYWREKYNRKRRKTDADMVQ